MNRLVVLLLSSAACIGAQTPWSEFLAQAEGHYCKGDYPEAVDAARQSLPFASTPEQRGRSLDRIGYLEYTKGSHPEAESALLEALKIREQLGRESQAYAETLLNLAMLDRDRGRLPEALKRADEGSAMLLRRVGGDDPAYAESLNVLATIHFLKGDLDKTDAAFEQGLRIHESRLDPDKPAEDYGSLCLQFAQALQRRGNYEKADRLLQKAMSAFAKNPCTRSTHHAFAVAIAAFLKYEIGDFQAAEKLYIEALAELKKRFASDDPRIGGLLNNLGVVYQSLGNYSAAETNYRGALAIARKGDNKIFLAVRLRNLGRLLLDQDRFQAEQLLQEAAGLLEQVETPPAFEYANTLLSLGQVQMMAGRYSLAAASLDRALKLAQEKLGERHPVYSAILLQLARLAEAQSRPEDAARIYRRAIESTTAARSRQHPQMAAYLAGLGALHSRQGNFDAAYPLFQEAVRIQENLQKQALGVGSEAAKSAMFSSLASLIPSLIAFQSQAGKTLPASRELAFEALVSRKGRVLDYVRDWRQSLRLAQGDAVPAILLEWQGVVSCQVSLMLAVGYRDWRRPLAGACANSGPDATRYELIARDAAANPTPERGSAAMSAIQELQARAAGLEDRLSREFPGFRENARPVSLAGIRSALQPDELLIEFVRYDAGTPNQPDVRYGAFLLDTRDGLDWTDLGPASSLDQSVSDLLGVAAGWAGAHSQRRPDLVAQNEARATRLVNLLPRGPLAPLWSSLSQRPHIRKLRVAPDGMLWLLPFEALPTAGRPVLHRYTVSYLLAARQLVEETRRSRPYTSALIAVSPGPGRLSARAASNTPFRADQLEPLPGARQEARRIQALLPGAALLDENEATEEALKRARPFSILHVIGHGLVRGDAECSPNSRRPDCALATLDSHARIMSLSAILLEEAYGRGRGSTQDGILTAQELSGLDLRNAEMLVLSQCRLADGVPAAGEGVYGMRRAAALSGARTFVAPLWAVADSVQSRLMTAYYRELRAGKDRAQALQQAKLRIASSPSTKHFLYWAPTILSGKIDPLPEIFRPEPGQTNAKTMVR